MQIYWHQEAAIKIYNELSPFTSIQRGVRQGCVLSPCLFNLYTEFIFRESNHLPGINIHGQNLNNIRYADDTALLANDEKKLQDIVTVVKEESSKKGLDMNIKKTKTMIISRNPSGKKVNIKVDGQNLEQIDKMKYLGTLITEEIKTDIEIETRSNLAKSKFSEMSKLLSSKRLKLKTKLKILNCYVFSIFTYGSEAWTLSKVLEDKIEATEMWCLRKMSNIQWRDRVTNEEVLRRLGTSRTLLDKIKKRKCRYYGHIKRKNNILTTAVEGRVEGKRPRGRPRNTWFKDIKVWTNQTAHDCTRSAADRHLWSVIARQRPKRR